MSANLNPGIKAVHLVLSRPTYTRPNNTTDIRDDYQSVKVWYSKVTPFDPNAAYNAVTNPWVLYSENGGLITTIDGLDENTTYYVKYAYISRIDPDTYTISSQLSAKTVAAGVHVYGWLSNDPVNISTDINGIILVSSNNVLVSNPTTTQQNAAWVTASTGKFIVYNDFTEVTGANTTTLAFDGSPVGPVYSIKSGSYTGSLNSNNVSINSITGEYKITNGVSVTDYNNSVIFLAKYNGVTLEYVWTVTKGRGGQTAPLIQLSANTTEFVYKQEIDTDSVTTSSVIKARLANITGQITWLAVAYTRAGNTLGYISGSQDQANNTFTITGSQFGYYGVTTGYVLATATSVSDNTVSDTITLYRINDGSNQITVEQSNGSHLITADYLGNSTYNDYDGSGNTITVKKGNRNLLIDNTSSDSFTADTWRIVSVVPSKNSSNVDTISYDGSYVATQGSSSAIFSRASGMTADVAYIDYTIRVQQVTGDGSVASQYLDTTVRQSFARSKAGSTAPSINLTALKQAAFIKSPASATDQGTWSPSTITLNADTFNIPVGTTYTWYEAINEGDYTFYTSGVDKKSVNIPQFTSGTKTYKIQATANTQTVYDVQTLWALESGGSGLVVALDNPSQNINCLATGVPYANLTINAQFLAIRGTTFINPSYFTFSQVSQTGLVSDTSTINSSGAISVPSSYIDSTISVKKATITYRMLGTAGTPGEGIDFNKTLTINKTLDGVKGDSGINSATVALYAASSSNTSYPTLPSGTFVYTFSSANLSPKSGTSSSLNSWSQAVPNLSLNQYLWGIYAAAASTTTSDEILSSEFSTPVVSSSGGTAGINTAAITLYNKNSSSTTPPGAFSGTFTYTFSNGILSGGTFANWSQTPPNLLQGEYLWARYAVAATSNSYDEVLATEFSAAVVAGAAGIDGTKGINTATIALYNKNTSSTTPPTAFSGTFTYTFSNAGLTYSAPSTLNNWQTTPPTIAKGEYLWVRYAVAASNSTYDTVEATEFSAAAIAGIGGIDGTAGINTATIALYNKNTSAVTAPAAFSGTFVYTFSSANLSTKSGTSSSLNSWSQTAPSIAKGEYLWVRYAIASSNTADDEILATDFSAAVVSGAAGTDGTSGKSTYTATVYLYSSSYPTTLNAPPAPYGGTYNFNSGILTQPGGWLLTQPDSDIYPTWAASYTFSTTTPADDVPGYSWTNVRAIAVKGAASTTPGPRNASGYLYYQRSLPTSASTPTKPSPSGWSWTTGTFSSPGTTDGYSWSTSPFTPNAGEVAYASRYYVTETTYGGTAIITTDNSVTSMTFSGLVTFTDPTYTSITGKANTADIPGAVTTNINTQINTSGTTLNTTLNSKIGTTEGDKVATAINSYRSPTTTINGGVIETGSINANQLTIGTLNRTGARIEMTNTSMTVYSDGTSTFPNGVKRVIIGYLG